MATTKTTLDSDVTEPSTTAPGDGPADTTDPTEVAVSVPFSPGDAARAAGTVNTVRPVGTDKMPPRDESNDRIEEYDVIIGIGKAARTVSMRHNIETGKTETVEN